MRILIVDDDYVSRVKLKAILSVHGDCDAAPSGDLAIRLFQSSHREEIPYELITMDINLPDISGIRVVQEIRQWEQGNGISPGDGAKVIMVTVSDDPPDVMNAFREGCEHFLRKPVSPDNVGAALKSLGF
jgi:two-component system, chemotaxis family, chemotaxis protein CheY